MDKTHFFNLINAGNINSGLLSENFARSHEEFLNFPVNLKGLPILIAADSALFEFSSKDVFQISEDEIWLSIADSDIKLWVSGIADSLEYRVDVFEPDASPLAVQGPLAAPLIADLFGQWVHDLKFFGFEKTKL